jgi:hypothetical protein
MADHDFENQHGQPVVRWRGVAIHFGSHRTRTDCDPPSSPVR